MKQTDRNHTGKDDTNYEQLFRIKHYGRWPPCKIVLGRDELKIIKVSGRNKTAKSIGLNLYSSSVSARNRKI